MWRETNSVRSRDRAVHPAPVPVLDFLPEDGLRIVGARYLAVDQEHRREDLAYRLPEAVGRVLHARGLLRETAVPRRSARRSRP